MFNSVVENPVVYSDPWELSFEKRYAALTARNRRVAYFYENPDATTFRYRVFNMVQALNADTSTDISAAWFHRDDLPHMARIVEHVDACVFCRTQFTPQIGELVTRAKRRGVRVLYDLDDLVFDTDHIQLILNSQGRDANDETLLTKWYAAVARQGALLKICDEVLVTNDFLANCVTKFSPDIPVSVIPNFLNRDQQVISTRMFNQKLDRNFESSPPFHIGYFSGTPTHRRDFEIAIPAITRLLATDNRFRLLIVGIRQPSPSLNKFIDKIDIYSLQDYMNLQRFIARTELNIAPLIDNVFTNCKSELKYFEAAITGTITIASPTFAFRHTILDGQTGLLANSYQWDGALETAVAMLDERARYATMAIAGHRNAETSRGWNCHGITIKRAIFG